MAENLFLGGRWAKSPLPARTSCLSNFHIIYSKNVRKFGDTFLPNLRDGIDRCAGLDVLIPKYNIYVRVKYAVIKMSKKLRTHFPDN